MDKILRYIYRDNLINFLLLSLYVANLIINYYCQTEQICSISYGVIESIIKQIDRRTKISGAQWKIENVPHVLAHRCAYLNGLICDR